jgi:thymidylate synthase ThyX
MKRFWFVLIILTIVSSARADKEIKQDAKDVFQASKNFVKHVFKKSKKTVKKAAHKVEKAVEDPPRTPASK